MKWFFPVAVSLLFSSCAAQMSGPLRADGSAEMNVSVSIQPRTTALIRALSAAAGVRAPSANAPLLDAAAIARSMGAAPGIESASFKNTAPAAIEGPVKVAKVSEFLAVGGAADGKTPRRQAAFISFEQTAAGGRCVINLALEDGPEMLALLSPDISGYLEALMAPLATGEKISKTEYLALVSMVYGEGVAGEISGSQVRASIEFPGVLQSVKGGTFSGKRAEFAIPLADLLVLENPLHYEAVWK